MIFSLKKMNDKPKTKFNQKEKLNNNVLTKIMEYSAINKNKNNHFSDINNKKFLFLEKNNINYKNIFNDDQLGNTIQNALSQNLDWGDCESIYSHLIS